MAVRTTLAGYSDYKKDPCRAAQRLGAAKDGPKRSLVGFGGGLEQVQDSLYSQPDIQPETPVLHVKQIKARSAADVLGPLDFPPVTLDLCQSGDARLHIAPAAVEFVEFLEFALVLNHVRPGTDDAHLSAQHVEKLGKLVDAETSQPTTAGVDAVILGRRLPRLVIIVHSHAAEFENLEDFAIFSHAVLTEKERAR